MRRLRGVIKLADATSPVGDKLKKADLSTGPKTPHEDLTLLVDELGKLPDVHTALAWVLLASMLDALRTTSTYAMRAIAPTVFHCCCILRRACL